MPFSPRIFISFLVVVKHFSSCWVYWNIFHGERWKKRRAIACCAHFINLRELSRWKFTIQSIGGYIGCKQYVLLVAKHNRISICRVCGQSFWCTTLGLHQIDIETSLSIGCKSDWFAVGRPYWIRVVTSMGSQLYGSPTRYGYFVDITFVRKGNLTSIGRYSTIAHP